MILSNRGILHVTASMRARRRGEIPSGFSPSPAQPCACLSVPTAHEGASTGTFPAARKYHLRQVAPIRHGIDGKHAQAVHNERERSFPLLCAWPTACADVSIPPAIIQVQPALYDTFAAGKVLVFAPSLAVGTDKQAEGCVGEGLNPEGISPRLRARMLAVTCKMLLFESLILDRLHQ